MISATLEELELYQGQRCLWCLVITEHPPFAPGRYSTLHIYHSAASRSRGLRHYQKESTLTNTVFHTFEIPIDVFLNGAKKYI